MVGIYRQGAVCKRGHVQTRDISRMPIGDRCPDCGAAVLKSCSRCGHRIRGDYDVPGVVAIGFSWEPPQFCDKCGAPHPWVNRQGRIYELENLLDDEELDPADELAAREQLHALASEDLDDEEQARRWMRVKRHAPGLFERLGAQRIIETVAAAAIRQQLGL